MSSPADYSNVIRRTIDLDKTLYKEKIENLFTVNDAYAHTFEVCVLRSGEPLDLTGCAVVGIFTRYKDRSSMVVDGGGIDGNVARITLTPGCYQKRTRFNFLMRLSNGPVKNNILNIEADMLLDQEDRIVDPDGVIPSVDELVAKLDDLEAAREEALDAAESVEEFKNEIREEIVPITQEAVNNWLDEHPEATTTVQDGSLTINKIAVGALGYVTPELYGAVGDGVTDDTAAVQAALNSGFDVRCAGVYLVTDLRIERPMCLHGGTFVNGGATGYILTVDADHVRIDGITVDGRNSCNGVMLNFGHSDLVLKNSIIYAIRHTDTTNGVYATNSYDITIENCHIYDVANINNMSTRGILINRCGRVLVSGCAVHDVVSNADGVGIQIIHDGADGTERNERVTITQCDLYNCSQRYVKIQQKNVILENCTMMEEKNTIEATQSSVAVYDSNITLRGNFLNGNSKIQVHMFGASDDTLERKNIRLENNTLIAAAVATSYQGIVTMTCEEGVRAYGLVFAGNKFVGNPTEYAVRMSGYCKRFMFANNVVSDCYAGIILDYSGQNNGAEFEELIVQGNAFDVRFYPIKVEANVIVDSLIANFNVYRNEKDHESRYGFLYNYGTFTNGNRIICANNVYADASTPERFIINYIREHGTAAKMPVYTAGTYPIPDGFEYFNEDIHQKLTYYGGANGAWYKPDGTVFVAE